MKIIFAPGIGASHRDFPEYREVFGPDFEIIRYKGCMTLEQHLLRIHTQLRDYEENAVEYILVGHSLGAHLVYRYLNKYRPRYAKAMVMVGGGPRFVPLNTWNTIFSLHPIIIAMVLGFIMLGAPFLFLLYGWHGMFQRINVIDLFRREGITNIRRIYNETLVPLLEDPESFSLEIPVLVVRLPHDLLYPESAFIETKELVPEIDEKIIPRKLIHFSHHLDVLVTGYIYDWFVQINLLPNKSMPFDVEYAMKYPDTVNVEMEGFSLPRFPFVLLLIIFIIQQITLKYPDTGISHAMISILSTGLSVLGISTIPLWVIVTSILVVGIILLLFYLALVPQLPREKQIRMRSYPKISIIVPMRNEARNIKSCVSSLLNLQYPNYEIILVDGRSEDDTVVVAQDTITKNNQMGVTVQLIEEPPLPQGWLGKSWACHTGQQYATGELLLFTDADTNHNPTSLREVTRIFAEQELDSLSIIGHLKTESFWERVVLPFFKSLLFTIFGGRFVNSRFSKRILGIGQYILITRTNYDRIGGHQAIKQYISEDIHLVTQAANQGKYAVFNGNSIYSVRMYRNWMEIKEGLGRNSVQSVGGNVWMVGLASLGLIVWRLGAPFIYLLSLNIGFSENINLLLLLLTVFTIGLYLIDVKVNDCPWYYLFFVPLGLFSLVYILLWGTFNKFGNKPLIWKGRSYSYE